MCKNGKRERWFNCLEFKNWVNMSKYVSTSWLPFFFYFLFFFKEGSKRPEFRLPGMLEFATELKQALFSIVGMEIICLYKQLHLSQVTLCRPHSREQTLLANHWEHQVGLQKEPVHLPPPDPSSTCVLGMLKCSQHCSDLTPFGCVAQEVICTHRQK